MSFIKLTCSQCQGSLEQVDDGLFQCPFCKTLYLRDGVHEVVEPDDNCPYASVHCDMYMCSSACRHHPNYLDDNMYFYRGGVSIRQATYYTDWVVEPPPGTLMADPDPFDKGR